MYIEYPKESTPKPNYIDKSHKHNAELECRHEKYILYNSNYISIHIKFKKVKTKQ